MEELACAGHHDVCTQVQVLDAFGTAQLVEGVEHDYVHSPGCNMCVCVRAHACACACVHAWHPC